eukprot:scaffold598586_cov53-Prasinocladus_malaysianus.AAC.1
MTVDVFQGDVDAAELVKTALEKVKSLGLRMGDELKDELKLMSEKTIALNAFGLSLFEPHHCDLTRAPVAIMHRLYNDLLSVVGR